MGRYYRGDINGKFWFAVQSSNAADRFGVCGEIPHYLEYYFDNESINDVNKGIENIEKSLGEKKILLDNLFKEKISYCTNDIDDLGISSKELEDYADLELGYKIRDCILENGECFFTAEL